MTRSRFRLAALVLVAFALVSSACFQIRFFSIVGTKALSPAEEGTFQFDLYRQSDGNDNTGYVFVMVGLQDLDYSGTGTFDMLGNWGGPYPTGGCGTGGRVCIDNALRNYLLTGTNCSANGVSASDIDSSQYDEWRLVRTTTKVSSASAGFDAPFRLRVQATREAGTTNDAFGHIVVFSGLWTDSGSTPGTIEAGEATCTSMVMTGMPFRP